MKQRFLLSILFVCSFMATTRAQIGKGSVWLGGSIGYSQSKNKSEGSTTSDKWHSFSISPAIGKAVKDNLVVGISATYGRYINKSGDNVERKDNTYGGGLFVRRYIPIIAQLYLYGEAEAFYLASRSKQETGAVNNGTVTIKSRNAGISISPGLSLGVNKFMQIEAGINSLFQTSYRNIKTTSSNVSGMESAESSFSTGIFLDNASQIFIGFRFLLNKKA